MALLNDCCVLMSVNRTLSEHHVVSLFTSTETLHSRLFMAIDGLHKET